MRPRRKRSVVNTRGNQVGDAPAIRQDQPPVGGIPAAAQAAAQAATIAANREEMQELHNMMHQILDRPMYTLPPPPAPGVAGPQHHQPPPPAPGVAGPQHHQSPPPVPRVEVPQHQQPQAPLARTEYFETMKLLGTMGTEYFSGGFDQVWADDWRQMLEKKFRTARCPVEFKKDLAVHYLRGEADYWWRNVERSLPVGYVPTWDDFLREFNNKYFPQEAMEQLDREFLDLRQGTKTVREYDAEFTRLRRFCVWNFGEQDMMRRFMRGLRADIRNRSSIRACTSLVELVEEAATMERGLEEEVRDLKSTQKKITKEVEPQKRTWDNYSRGQGQNRFSECYMW